MAVPPNALTARASEEMKMKCSHCGKETPEGSVFCINCGSFIEVTAPVTEQPVPAPAP
ncbi:MAG: zinc ribbon domain-containing protein, partial [Clostridia bacterium]|nr:zinc ribbon domain-containing protein [Clostridia bacterium]